MGFWRPPSRSGTLELKCSRCGYDLMGSKAPVCPECGASVLESVAQRDRGVGIGSSIPMAFQRAAGRPWWKRPPTPPSVHVVFGVIMSVFSGYMCTRALRGEQLMSLARSSRRLMTPSEGAWSYGVMSVVGIVIASIGVWQILRARRARGS